MSLRYAGAATLELGLYCDKIVSSMEEWEGRKVKSRCSATVPARRWWLEDRYGGSGQTVLILIDTDSIWVC